MKIKFISSLAVALFLAGCSAGEKSGNKSAPIVSNKLGDVKSYAMQQDEEFSSDDLNFEGIENFSEEVKSEVSLLKHKVYFGFDRFSVSGDNKKYVQDNAKFLVKNPNIPVMLTGNTDPRGSQSYNFHLGERRANAVKAMLVKEGVPESQLCTVSYGDLRPAVTPNRASIDWKKAYKLDRRVEFVYGQKCEGEINKK